MEGKGKKNCYLGIDTPYQSAKFVIQPVPFDMTTTYIKGTDKGPAALIEASRNLELYDIETQSEVYKEGIYTADPVNSFSSQEMFQITFEKVKKHLNKDKFVFTIGGEHSISYAPIKAHAEKYGSIGVLQLDAHADLYPSYEGNPLSHASVMARVKSIPEVNEIVSVGIRSLAKVELNEQKGIHTFYAEKINKNWIMQIIEKLPKIVYITFDVDVFDPSIMPSTGTPEPGGLFWDQILELIKKVSIEKQIIGCDLVELCPIPRLIAPDFLAAKLIYKILSYVNTGIKK